MDTPAGFILSWRVPTTVDLAQLRTGLTLAGLSTDLAPDLRPASLVSRASGFIARSTSGKHARKLSRPTGHAARQITREESIGDELHYSREMALGLGVDGKTLVCDNPMIDTPNVALTITTTRTASDVTRVIQQIVEAAGADLIPVREQGGAYFVPSGHGLIGQVDTVLQAIGGELSRFAVTLGHGSDASVANTITDYMLKQIADLKESVDELNEAGIRSDVKSRRLTRVAELRERVAAYAGLVTTQGVKLTEAIDKAEAVLLAKLGASATEAAA